MHYLYYIKISFKFFLAFLTLANCKQKADYSPVKTAFLVTEHTEVFVFEPVKDFVRVRKCDIKVEGAEAQNFDCLKYPKESATSFPLYSKERLRSEFFNAIFQVTAQNRSSSSFDATKNTFNNLTTLIRLFGEEVLTDQQKSNMVAAKNSLDYFEAYQNAIDELLEKIFNQSIEIKLSYRNVEKFIGQKNLAAYLLNKLATGAIGGAPEIQGPPPLSPKPPQSRKKMLSTDKLNQLFSTYFAHVLGLKGSFRLASVLQSPSEINELITKLDNRLSFADAKFSMNGSVFADFNIFPYYAQICTSNQSFFPFRLASLSPRSWSSLASASADLKSIIAPNSFLHYSDRRLDFMNLDPRIAYEISFSNQKHYKNTPANFKVSLWKRNDKLEILRICAERRVVYEEPPFIEAAL